MRLKLPILGLFSALALQLHAVEFITTNTYLIAEDQVVSNEQWVLAGIAQTDGIFKNDLFITSGNPLKLNGTFDGNIWGAAGMEAGLAGSCERNVRLASGKVVRIDGTIGGNLMALGETIILGTNSLIKGNVRLMASSIIIEGRIEGQARLSAARVATLGGSVGGNMQVTAPDVLFSRDTRILGNLTYKANKELVPAEGVVAGTVQRTHPPSLFTTDRFYVIGLWCVAAFLAGVPFITLFPVTTAMASQLIKRSPWKCLLVGILASGALPMFGIMCASSLVGIPLGGLILAAYGLMFYLSRIISALVLGTLLLRSANTSIGRVLLAMALGLAIIYLSTVVPSIGMPVQLAVLWLGMGSLILAALEKRKLIIQLPQSLAQLETLKNETNNPEEK